MQTLLEVYQKAVVEIKDVPNFEGMRWFTMY